MTVNTFAEKRRWRDAFTLIEIMVTVALLSFIILGLMAMFQQTQRAFRNSITQTDVLENARAVSDLMAREIEQTTPSKLPPGTAGVYRATNFFVELTPAMVPSIQDLPGTTRKRVNMFQRFFFLRRENQDWIGTGYQVIPDHNGGGVGTLYRFTTNSTVYTAGLLSGWFQFLSAVDVVNALATPDPRPVTNMVRLMDGVVHLRLQCFATNGLPLTNWNGVNGFFLSPITTNFIPVTDSTNYPNAYDPNQVGSYFYNDAVPAYVELEFAALEPQVLRRYRALANDTVRREYLSNHVGQVHVFRQRIPIRNIDFSPYQ